jgi:homoserine dehydrogenase
MERIKVGLFGFGTVGTGVVRVLRENRDQIRTRLGVELELARIVDVDLNRHRGVEVERGVLSNDPKAILGDPQISIVVELIGGEEEALEIILQAVKAGKHVVTANKALLASRGNEIFKAAQENGVDVAFEGSVCGGIPVIRALKEGLAANQITQIQGIVNGTSNFILTEMTDRGDDFNSVLAKAQRMGYAEADPTLDVEGIDAAHKLSILLALAYGTPIRFEEIYVEGITRVEPLDIQFAKELGYKIKLLAITKNHGDEVEARVHPTMIPLGSPLSTVDGVFNALFIEGNAVGPTFFYGMGAGMMPTASAVVGDLMELARNLLKGISQRLPCLSAPWPELRDIPIRPMGEVRTNYYLRFTALDKPGVLSAISGILGKEDISILSVVQKGRRGDGGGGVPVVMMTHEAKEEAVRRALKEIDSLPVTVAPTQVIRVEDESIKDANL